MVFNNIGLLVIDDDHRIGFGYSVGEHADRPRSRRDGWRNFIGCGDAWAARKPKPIAICSTTRRRSPPTRKKIEALKEFTALGSGLRLAMRDMEIRGAGNLLGPQQHGDMAAVGIETYSRLLNEEIQKQQGDAIEETNEGPLFEMSLSAYLPDDYMPVESERVLMYKRVLSSSASSSSR